MVCSWPSRTTAESASKLGEAADVYAESIRRFVDEYGDLKLTTVDKLFNALGIAVVRNPKPRPPISKRPQPSLDEVRSAIDAKGLSRSELARQSGVSVETIRSIQMGRPHLNLQYTTLAKLAKPLGLKLDPSSPVEPISAPRDSATSKETSPDQTATISPASPKPSPSWPPGRCPVSFGTDGRPVAGQPKKVTPRQAKVIRVLLDAGPDGLTGEELEAKSGCGGYRNILTTLAKDEDWRSRIRLAGGPRGRYRFVMPGEK